MAEVLDPATAESVPGGAESLECYLREVSRFDLLSAPAERALAYRTTRGDPAALEEMISRNLRLVIHWAKRCRSSGMPLQDLIQEGNLGLMRAVEKFDPRRGTRFSTYASWWIRQALIHAICEKRDIIRIPFHMHQKMRIIDRMLENRGGLESDLDIEATVDEFDLISFKDWQGARRLQHSVSLDRGAYEERDGLIEVEDRKAINPMHGVYLREVKDHVTTLLKKLSPRQRSVLTLRYGLDGETEHTLEEIGVRLHLSRERVRQIQNEAVSRMAENKQLLTPRRARQGFSGAHSGAARLPGVLPCATLWRNGQKDLQ
ncbi:MAG: sigma-70 family RNA polymerase sigma factor [Candidatus Polarisedimenticolia bacterium]